MTDIDTTAPAPLDLPAIVRLTPHWSHVALNCSDPELTERFYQRHFGFRRARVVPLGDDQIVFLRAGDVYLELFRATGGDEPLPPAGPDGPSRPGLARHIAFQIDDLDGFLQRLGAEAEIALGPLSFEELLPGWRSVWLRDPDGVIVEVGQGFRDFASDQNGGPR